jgi:hypothetical protein
MNLGTVYISTKFRPDRTSNIAARWKHTFASIFITTFRLAIISFKLAIITFRQAIITFRLAIITFRLAIITFRLAIITFRLAIITFRLAIMLAIITFSLSRTIVDVSHVAAGEHMVPGPFMYNSVSSLCKVITW